MSTKNYKRTVVVNGVTYPKVVEEAVFDKYTKQKLSDKLKSMDNQIENMSETIASNWTELKFGNYAQYSQSEVSSIIVNQFGLISDPAGMIYNKDAREISNSVLNQLYNESKFVIGGTVEVSGLGKIFKYIDLTEHFRNKIVNLSDLVTNQPSSYIQNILMRLQNAGITNIGYYVNIPEFYYRTIQVTTTAETYEDCWLIQFSKTAISDSQGNWQHWNNNSFVAAFLGTKHNTFGMQSVPTNDAYIASYNTWRSDLTGTGLRMINYTEVKALQYLFYAWYGNTDSQALLGGGVEDIETSYVKWCCIAKSGSTDIIPVLHDGISEGFSDNTFLQNVGNYVRYHYTLYGNCFWGIHNLFGVQYQFIYGLNCVQDGDDENVYALVDTQTGGSQRIICKNTDFEDEAIDGWTSKLKFGNYADNYPIEVNGHDGTDYYADYGYASFGASCVSGFGGGGAYSAAGVGYVSFADDGADYSVPSFGARLLYQGNAQEVNL